MKINITLKGKSLADKKRHKLIYQVSCPGESQKQIETDLAIYKQFWLNKKKKVSTKHPNWDIVNDQIIKYKDEAERLMLEYDLKRISLKGVYTKLKGEISDKSVDQFVNTWTKKNKSDSTFKHYVNCLSSFKNAVGVKGELKFSAIDKSLINKFHRAANDKIRKREWSTVTAKNYMTTFKSICTDAEDEDVIDTPIPFKRSYKWNQYKSKDNYAPTNEEIAKLIFNIKNIRHWQSCAIWLLEFCCRGLYPQDLTDFDDNRLLNKKLESMENYFLKGEEYIDHYRGKNVMPMFIRLYPITLSIIRRLKFSLVFTDADEKIGDKNIITTIDNRINLVQYDRVKYSSKHHQFWRKFTDNFKKLGNSKINLMTPRKAFIQVANDIKEIGYENAQKLAGHKLGGVADKFYLNYKKYETITEIDRMHLMVLEEFQVEKLLDLLINKLYDLTEGKVPKWVLMNGGVHKVGRKYKILTGDENRVEDADMDSKFIKYFIPTKEWEMEREIDEYDRMKKSWEEFKNYDIPEHIKEALAEDIKDLKASRKVRDINEAGKLFKRA
jgi:hypothetical protein